MLCSVSVSLVLGLIIRSGELRLLVELNPQWPRARTEGTMPDTFGSDVLVALVSAVFAAVLTAIAGYVAYRFELSRRQREAVRHLAQVLASRRAMKGPLEAIRVDASDPRLSADLESCRHSVRYARDSIVEVNRAVRPGSPAQNPLDSMTQATNQFLTSSNRDPNSYWLQLNDLREKLTRGIEHLGIATRQQLPAPGSQL